MYRFAAKIILFIYRQLNKVILSARIEIIKSQCTFEKTVVFFEEAKVNNFFGNKLKLYIDQESRIRGELSIFSEDGSIAIGKCCYVGDFTRIWSAKSIIIGDRVLISHNVNIHDFDSHPLSVSRRHLQAMKIFKKGHTGDLDDVASSSIIIEDDAWIGFGATILKGVKIGKGAIIGANSVVTHDIPEYSVAVGNPAVVIKRLKNE